MWLVYATLASLFWGMTYAFADQVLKRVSVPTLILIEAIPNVILALALGFAGHKFATDWQTIKGAPQDWKLYVATFVVCAIANLFIALSIQSKNATMAGMIEITYPLFTALFAWALFREVQVNMGTLMGALLILSGVSCIYFYGKNI